MNKRQLEHVLRAAAAITGEREFVFVGSQAVLAQHSRPPAAMQESNEIDLYPRHRPDLADVVDGAIGRDSQFHRTFGYYADGVGPETAKLPRGWEERAYRLRNPRTGGATAVCPELHDLAAAKMIAGREKDLRWVEAARDAGLLSLTLLADRLGQVPVTEPERAVALRRARDLSRR